MSGDMLHHELTEAIPGPPPAGDTADKGGRPHESLGVAAEQSREQKESQDAQDRQGGVRDRLVDIGKANHMAGRGNGRVSDR
ncbi:hypothetical protein OJF2_77380 [Aquisphaera giovannonii]|uniref:Uncharacterized protein n=1 Tax=Aquisphaera giovannonii TaxID=406548 RepID=A0A5B9WEP9_9BACT|nr:hypothetical protein [Aquisphaera giovannonii]QEH39126.1 hypothetical protein OJF2_77380 [Aquisphaera giovannonii]